MGSSPESQEGPLLYVREHGDLIEADLALLRRLLPPDAPVLDVGAGRGRFVAQACRRGVHCLALDLQPAAARIWARDDLPGVLGDATATPFVDACFEVVRMKEIIEHLEEPLTLVREARRLLKPGGLLMAHVPTPYSQLYPVGNFWDDYTHVRPLSRRGLLRLFADGGFEVLRIDGYTSGRNPAERALGRVLAYVLPHSYRVLARKPRPAP